MQLFDKNGNIKNLQEITDSGWQNGSFFSGSGTIKARKLNGVIYVKINISCTSNNFFFLVGKLPSGFEPSEEIRFCGGSDQNGPTHILIANNGNVSVVGVGGKSLSVNGMTSYIK